MRIVSWNCNGAFRKKWSILNSLHGDIYIVQECENPEISKDVDYQKWARNHLWIGKNSGRGLGVFCMTDSSLSHVPLPDHGLELFLPCMIDDKVALLAAWTKQANSPTFKYIGQLWKWLQQHGQFLEHGQSLLVGDLNSNARWDVWDRWWNHSDVVRELEQRGLKSLYHVFHGEAQGHETIPTFFHYRDCKRPYHIDYAFLSSSLLKDAAMSIGAIESWLEHSDHMPLIIDIPASE